jgi:hypothetical protein
VAHLISLAAGLGILLIGGLIVEFCDFAPYGVATIVAVGVSSAATGIVSARRASPATAFGHALGAAAFIAAAAFVGFWMIFGAQSCGE